MSEPKTDQTDEDTSASPSDGAADKAPAAASPPAEVPPSETAPAGAAPATEAAAEPSAAPAEAVAPAAAEPAPDSTSGEDEQEVEPEIIPSTPTQPKPSSHHPHPPPPPSIRFKSVIAQQGPAAQSDPRFVVNGKPRVARDLMIRKIFTIGPKDTLEHLEEHMHAFRFRHLPVIDGDKLVGLITHRDLLHASSSFLSERAKERDEIIHKLPAERIMHKDLVTARPDTPLVDIARLMWQKKIGCVLVTDEQGILVGIVTEGDFIRLAHHFLVSAAPAS